MAAIRGRNNHFLDFKDCYCPNTESEITVKHRTFPNQMCWMSEHFRFLSDIMSGKRFLFFIDLKHFLYYCLKKSPKCLIKISFLLILCLGIYLVLFRALK